MHTDIGRTIVYLLVIAVFSPLLDKGFVSLFLVVGVAILSFDLLRKLVGERLHSVVLRSFFEGISLVLVVYLLAYLLF